MRAVERLTRDHVTLRSKLVILESALQVGPQAWFTLRELCHTLARQLRDHIRREEALVAACRSALAPDMLREISVEHLDEPQRLQMLNRLFLDERGESMERIRPALTAIIGGLRHHMDEEERELFPVLEQILAGRDDVPAGAPPTPHFDETMTVNRIVHQFPETAPVFRRLFVNILCEGSDCLDEVAWRHGLESRELLANLERVIRDGEVAARGAAEVAREGAAAVGRMRR